MHLDAPGVHEVVAHALGPLDHLLGAAAPHQSPDRALEPGGDLRRAVGDLVDDLLGVVLLTDDLARRRLAHQPVVPDEVLDPAPVPVGRLLELAAVADVAGRRPLDREVELVGERHPRVGAVGGEVGVRHPTDAQDGHVVGLLASRPGTR